MSSVFFYPLLHFLCMLPTIGRELRQHNDLTKACLQLTANELNVFYCVVAMVRQDDGPGTTYRLHLADMEEQTGQDWNYQQFKKTTTALRSRGVELATAGGVLQAGLVASVTYHENKGYVDLELAEKIKPYVVSVKRCFTRFYLGSLLSLSSKYSKCLYLALSQWRDKSATPTYSIDELRVTLAAIDSYSKPSALLTQVIRPAVKEIKRKTELDVQVVVEGRGSRLRVKFHIDCQPVAVPSGVQQKAPEVVKSASNVEDGELASQHRALVQLSELNILDNGLVRLISGTPSYRAALFKFTHDMRIGKLKSRNPAGLFLHIVGLR